jgi:hypothetical protein
MDFGVYLALGAKHRCDIQFFLDIMPASDDTWRIVGIRLVSYRVIEMCAGTIIFLLAAALIFHVLNRVVEHDFGR